jgi:hypothetical protein
MIEWSSVTCVTSAHVTNTLAISHTFAGCGRPERFLVSKEDSSHRDHMNRSREGEFEKSMTLLRLDKVALIELRMMPTSNDMTSGWWFQRSFVDQSGNSR